MNVILGATGQVGSAIANNLSRSNEPVRGVIKNAGKTSQLEKKGIEVSIANYFDLEALKKGIKDGDLIFVLTPETGKSDNILADTQTILENYREAIKSSEIKQIIGLSSIGAQHKNGTGSLLMSYMLEHAFTEMSMPQVFVRPAYYYSNWLLYLSTVKEQGVLPTFFPEDLQIPMISPIDVAEFISHKIRNGIEESSISEIVGPEDMSSNDVANIFGQVLDCEVKAQQIPRNQWKKTLQKAGFTEDAIKNLIAMTEAVIAGRVKPEGKDSNPIKLQTTLKQYLEENIK